MVKPNKQAVPRKASGLQEALYDESLDALTFAPQPEGARVLDIRIFEDKSSRVHDGVLQDKDVGPYISFVSFLS